MWWTGKAGCQNGRRLIHDTYSFSKDAAQPAHGVQSAPFCRQKSAFNAVLKSQRNKTGGSEKEVNMKTESTVMESADIVIGSFVLTQWGLRISRWRLCLWQRVFSMCQLGYISSSEEGRRWPQGRQAVSKNSQRHNGGGACCKFALRKIRISQHSKLCNRFFFGKAELECSIRFQIPFV